MINLNQNNCTNVTTSNKINFFIGSGASSAFGYPSMTQITKDFRVSIDSGASPEPGFVSVAKMLEDSEKAVGKVAPSMMQTNNYQGLPNSDQNTRLSRKYNEIYNTMNSVWPNKVDIESIMSVVVGLKEQENIYENIGDFGLYKLQRNRNLQNNSSVFGNGSVEDIEDLKLLEERYKSFIREKMLLDPTRIGLINKIYDNFFGALCSAIEQNGVGENIKPYSETKSTMHHKFNIFTTNYDTAIEKYFKDKLKYDVDTGAIGTDSVIDMERFFQTVFCKPYDKHLNLIKLHGSINWVRDSNNILIQKGYNANIENIRQENELDTIKDEVIIYPLSQKHLYLTPFIQLFNYFEKELRSLDNKVWIVIGYSFRDIIVKQMFENSIDTIKGIILVDPNSEKIKSSFDERTRDKITEIKSEFGSTLNYEKVNREIANKLKEI